MFGGLLAVVGAIVLQMYPDNIVVFTLGNILYTLGVFCPLTFVTSLFTKAIPEGRDGLFIGIFRALSAGIRVLGSLIAADTIQSASVDQCQHHHSPTENRTSDFTSLEHAEGSSAGSNLLLGVVAALIIVQTGIVSICCPAGRGMNDDDDDDYDDGSEYDDDAYYLEERE